MKNFSMALVAAAVLSAAPTAASAATVTYNSTPASTWFYGNGNNYAPANTTVLTTDDASQVYLRWHQTGQPAPASNNGVYNLALGTSPVSFDWGVTFNNVAGSTSPSGTLTITDVGTGQSVSYNPFFLGNDNATQVDGFGRSFQNSARLNFGFLFGASFNPNVDSTYTVRFDLADGRALPGGASLTSTVNIGAGVPEPATWAMMLLGFGAIGSALRRRSKVTTGVRYA